MRYKFSYPLNYFSVLLFLSLFSCKLEQREIGSGSASQPNILFIIADDWSYPHAGIHGDPAVKTPNFDRIGMEGILFDNAYVSSPSCTPSRAAILTGQHFWRLQEGGNLYGPLRSEYPVFTDLLEESGYKVGFTRKGWGPGKHEGRPRNPAGDKFDSFEEFLNDSPSDKPFCFWFGSHEPHRGYEEGSGGAAEIAIDQIQLPACLPDSKEIRSDVADYLLEVQHFDNQIGELLLKLESIDQLDNTLIAVTSDNGMPFPRCKSNVYDLGTRVPLAIRWGNEIKNPIRYNGFVSLTDLAPTFLHAANLPIPEQMTGRSLLTLLKTGNDSEQNRDQVFFGKERHVPGQESGDWSGYPSRAMRNNDFVYIKNFLPDLWPAGTPDYDKATFYPSYYGDVDGGPTKWYMIDRRGDNETNDRLFTLAFEKRPEEELYDLKNDPDQLVNVSNEVEYAETKENLKKRLLEELKRTGDPRVVGGEEIFSSYPYSGGTPAPRNFKKEN